MIIINNLEKKNVLSNSKSYKEALQNLPECIHFDSKTETFCVIPSILRLNLDGL